MLLCAWRKQSFQQCSPVLSLAVSLLPYPLEKSVVCMERVGIKKKRGGLMRDREILDKESRTVEDWRKKKKRATVCSQSQISLASRCNKHNKRDGGRGGYG